MCVRVWVEFLLQPLFTSEASLPGPGAFWWSAKCARLYVGIGDPNLDLMLARQAFYLLSRLPSLTMVFFFFFNVKHVKSIVEDLDTKTWSLEILQEFTI